MMRTNNPIFIPKPFLFLLPFLLYTFFGHSDASSIVTSSGSNAWYKSAGGKPFPEQDILKFLVREPFSGRIFKPKILVGEIKPREKISFESKRYAGGVIALDSDAVYEFNNNDKAEIQLSDKPLNVIK